MRLAVLVALSLLVCGPAPPVDATPNRTMKVDIEIVAVAPSPSSLPSVVYVFLSPLDEFPPSPGMAGSKSRGLFASAEALQKYTQAFYRHLQQLKRHGIADAEIVKWHERVEPRLQTALQTLAEESRRLAVQVSPAEALYVQHLEAWLRLRLANEAWERAMGEIEGSNSEAALQRLDAGPAYSSSMRLLATISRSEEPYEGRVLAEIQRSYLLREAASGPESLALARKLVCSSTTEWTPEAYAKCSPQKLSIERQSYVWMQLVGQTHFERNELPFAIAAYKRAAAVGGTNSALAHYMLAWSYYRQDQYSRAIASFLHLLRIPGSPARLFHAEARTYIAMSIVDQWETSKTKSEIGLAPRVESALSGEILQARRVAILEEVLRLAKDMRLTHQLARLESLLLSWRD